MVLLIMNTPNPHAACKYCGKPAVRETFNGSQYWLCHACIKEWQKTKLLTNGLNPHAQALGRLAKGKPKNYTPTERQRRAEWAKRLTQRRKEKNGNENNISPRQIPSML